MILEFVEKYALVGALGLAALGWAGAGVQTIRISWIKQEALQEKLDAVNASERKSQEAEVENGKVIDELLKKTAAANDAADAANERLRKLSTKRSPTASACAGSDEAAAGILPDNIREALVAEAKRADAVARQLTAAQEHIEIIRRACLQTER